MKKISSALTRSLVIAFILLFENRIGSAISLNAVSTSTGTGDTSMGFVQRAIKYFKYSTGVTSHLFITATQDPDLTQGIKVFTKSGDLLGKMSQASTGVTTLAVLDPFKILTFATDSKVVSMPLQFNSNTVAVYSSQEATTSFSMVVSTEVQSSVYVMILESVHGYVLKLDSASLSIQNSGVVRSTVETFTIANYNSDYVVFHGKDRFLTIVKIADLSVTKKLDTIDTLCSVFVLDNIRQDTVFEVGRSTDLTSFWLSNFDLQTATAGNTIRQTAKYSLAVSTSTYSNILNFGPYQYVGLIEVSDGVVLYSKPDLLRVKMFPLNNVLYFSLAGGFESGSLKYYFGFIRDISSVYNFQSYYLLFDNCLLLDSTNRCKKCFPGYYLNSLSPGNNCQLLSSLPADKGLDNSNFLGRPCASQGCIDCRSDYKVCFKCDKSKPVYWKENQCKETSTIAEGYGLNLATKTVSVCYHSDCQACQSNHCECTKCLPGYYLSTIDSTCNLKRNCIPFLVLHPVKAEKNFEQVDLVVEMQRQEPFPVGINATTFFPGFSRIASPQLEFYYRGRLESNLDYLSWYVWTGRQLQVYLRFKSPPRMEEYKISVKSSTIQKAKVNDNLFCNVQFTNAHFIHKPIGRYDKIIAAEKLGKSFSVLFMSEVNPRFAFPLLFLAMTLDRSGVIMRGYHFFKVISKLYYININYGDRLTAFLFQIRHHFWKTTRLSSKETTENSKNWRGKFSKDQQPLDMNDIYWPEMLIYIASCGVQILHYVLTFYLEVPRFYLWLMYIAQRIHLIIFNLVFVDFILYAARTILQSANIDTTLMISVWFVSVLLLVDFTVICYQVLNSKIWETIFKRKLKTRQGKQKPRKKLNNVSAAKGKLEIIFKSEKKDQELRQNQEEDDSRAAIAEDEDVLRSKYTFNEEKYTQAILNYPRTYVEYRSNYNLIRYSSPFLQIEKSVYGKKRNRLMYLFHLVKLGLFAAVVIGTQYCTGLGSFMLLCVELLSVSLVFFSILKPRMYRSPLMFTIDLLNTLPRLILFIICFSIHNKRFDEAISDFYQDAGIWIVIASCVAEYLLLLTYIGVAAYEFFKNRKSKKAFLRRLFCDDFIVYEVELDTTDTDMCEREPLEPDFFKEDSPKKSKTIQLEDDDKRGLSCGLTNHENDMGSVLLDQEEGNQAKADIFRLKEAKQSSDTIASDAPKFQLEETLALPKIEPQAHCEQKIQKAVWVPPPSNMQSAINSSARLLPDPTPKYTPNQEKSKLKVAPKLPITGEKPDKLQPPGASCRKQQPPLNLQSASQNVPPSRILPIDSDGGLKPTRAKRSVAATAVYKSYEEPINFSDVRKPPRPPTPKQNSEDLTVWPTREDSNQKCIEKSTFNSIVPDSTDLDVLKPGPKIDRKTTWIEYNAGPSLSNLEPSQVMKNEVISLRNPPEPKKNKVQEMYKRGARQGDQTDTRITNITIQRNEYITMVQTDAIERGLKESAISHKPETNEKPEWEQSLFNQPDKGITAQVNPSSLGFSSIQESSLSISAPKDLANETPEESAARKKREALHRRRRHKEVEIEDLPLPGAIFIPPAQFGAPNNNLGGRLKPGASAFEIVQPKRLDQSSSFSIDSEKPSIGGKPTHSSVERKEPNLTGNKFDLRDSIIKKAGIESLDPNFKKSYK